ncbi:hypothetical protein E5N72_10940 [Pseudoalteromonas sp. MEBiC 03607]|uniref:hypothetical protein n=1 Tax=Pseudoalteromonas sp. MEBiC 03607 TaxID=2563601 RepID=UPI00109399A9|nr:hypothetical protein [Pseudoalteromonas sp. MEBiC 03607]TGV20556.1 hypothetical protein E5N72_10940 [Pseudoalteromonas sp. MEBiC 03607]
MSRWQEQFETHPFQKIWAQLNDVLVDLKVDDDSVLTDVEEVARLKKVVKFINELLEAIDPELVPVSTWQNFQKQCQPCFNEVNAYLSDRNISHITNANANVDNLLTYVRPYVVESNKRARATQLAYRSYSEAISDGLKSFKNETIEYYNEFKEYSGELRDLKIKFVQKFKDIESTHKEISTLRNKYFEGSDSEKSIEARMNEMVNELEENLIKIRDYQEELLESGSDSIKTQISAAKEEAQNDSEAITELLHGTEEQLKQLKLFYTDVMGNKDEDGNLKGGLKQEIVDRKKHLDDFKIKQEERYEALNSQIEELLPAATSAGLAAAYRAMRKSFAKPIKQYSILFYISVFVLSFTAFISTIDGIWTVDSVIKFIDVSDYKNLLSNLTYKLPVILPVLWLALFASKRRSEALRLQQEYSHKEALAKSYQNFKNQVDSLHAGKKEELLEKLLGAAIDAVASNASDTLDKKHGDKTPAHEGLDKTVISLEKLKGIFK